MKKLFVFIFNVLLAFSCFTQTKLSTKNGSILHCWCWSFKTIEANIPEIAKSGFTALQTSPINTCLEGDYGGLDLLGIELTGKWYYHYQPTAWKIGNYQLGTRDEFISMCKKAEEYGIAVIIDVLPNHTTPRKDKVLPEFIEAVGGVENLYHANGDRGLTNFADRLQCTTYKMGGLPDVNTENPLFQKYFMAYMNDVIDCGGDGFRFDTAKHVGLPDDPKDPAAKENDFWPIFTGKKSIDGVMLENSDNLFLYGEVLQGGNSREGSYSKYMSVVASDFGGVLRSALKNRKLSAIGLKDWKNEAGKDKIVTWVETHDTYANYGESAKLSNFELRAGWAFITARDGGTPLFFNRPQGPESTQFPGVSKIGDKGNDEFKNPEVIEVNKFRIAMQGENEELLNGNDMSLIMVKRGEKGIVIINADSKKGAKINVKIGLPNGVYKDKAHGYKFSVSDGVLTGKVSKEKIAIIY